MGITGRKWNKIHHVGTIKPRYNWASWILDVVMVAVILKFVIYLLTHMF